MPANERARKHGFPDPEAVERKQAWNMRHVAVRVEIAVRDARVRGDAGHRLVDADDPATVDPARLERRRDVQVVGPGAVVVAPSNREHVVGAARLLARSWDSDSATRRRALSCER